MSIVGKHIVITRALHQATQLSTAISAQGGIPVLYPCIAITPTQDVDAIIYTINRISQGEFDWILFTSTNAITVFYGFVQQYAASFVFHTPVQIGVIGKQSAQHFHQLFHYPVTVVAPDEDANSLEFAIQQRGVQAICWFTSTLAPARFASFTAQLHRLNIYDTIIPATTTSLTEISTLSDLITFTSPSCVNNFATIAWDLSPFLPIPIACMGNSTWVTAQQYGFNIVVSTTHHNIDVFVAHISHYFAKESLR